MKKSALTAVALSVFFIPVTDVNAKMSQDNWPYWYLSASTALQYVSDADLKVAGAPSGDLGIKPDFSFGVALGYRPRGSNGFADHTRYEVEYNHRNFSFDKLNTGAGRVGVEGENAIESIMFNAFYDMPGGKKSKTAPYIGGGVGLAMWDLDSGTLSVDDDDSVFAYQFMLGVNFMPSTMPNVAWGIGYRYFSTMDPEFKTITGDSIDYGIGAHNLELSGRFHF